MTRSSREVNNIRSVPEPEDWQPPSLDLFFLFDKIMEKRILSPGQK